MQLFMNDKLGSVRAIYEKDGSISVNAEDVSSGLGFVQMKNGKEYVRWATVRAYLLEFGYSHPVGKDDFIPESMFYMLGMRANNQIARDFQFWIATEVVPSIRKHGAFIADSENIDEKFVMNELRFSQKRTIKSFSNSSPNEIRQLYEDFKEYVNSEYKYKTSDRLSRYKSVEKGLDQLLDKMPSNHKTIGDVYNIKQLKEEVILDRTTLEKKISGGIRSGQTRLIGELQEELDGYKYQDE